MAYGSAARGGVRVRAPGGGWPAGGGDGGEDVRVQSHYWIYSTIRALRQTQRTQSAANQNLVSFVKIHCALCSKISSDVGRFQFSLILTKSKQSQIPAVFYLCAP